ncbi:MAG: geranylgeranyl reductase family protein [Nitrospiraceae bacterium]|nr:MAG: geranylgeranyl reductase family protein [Nitrospiraceae bacterium]
MPTLPDVKVYDALVVGMGPAGATTAYQLSRAGLSVLGLDKATHPRYKVCGGGLSARVDRILGDDYKSVVEQTIYGIQFSYRGADPIFIDSSSPIAYMVMRDRFDHFLVEKARGVGTEVHEDEPVTSCRQLPDGIEVRTGRGRYLAKVVIGADGANSVVSQQLFPGRRRRRMATLESEIPIGTIPHYPGTGRALIDVGATPKGYAWVFPKQDRLSIGVGDLRGGLASPKKIFDQFVQDEKGLDPWQIPQPVGHPLPLFSEHSLAEDNRESTELVKGRALLVGDAAHLVDPLFGEGIYYAVRSGQLAAESIVNQVNDQRRSLAEYEGAVRQEIYEEFRVALRMASLLYSYPRFCHSLIPRYQQIVTLYYDVLRGCETYQTFLARAKGMIKSSFKDLLLQAVSFR